MFYYGFIQDKPDQRDLKLAATSPMTLLPSVDLRSECPPVYDQGQLSSCTANALAFLYQFDLMKNLDYVFLPSRLWLYYNERVRENTVTTDAGADLRDGMKVINSPGLAAEKWWPYDVTKFADTPPASAHASAGFHTSIKYQAPVQDETVLKTVLTSGQPIAFGFTVYQSFESDDVAATGIVPMPDVTNESVIGGHAVALVGYDDSDSTFLVRNSWGSSWGLAGYCKMPKAYILDANLANSFWVLNTVTG